MGGTGSGAKRSTCIGNVEDAIALDIRALRRLGVVSVGECVIDTVQWRIGGLCASSVRLRVDLCDIERGGDMIVTGDMPGGVINQRIIIDAVPAPMGGRRCFFICPVSGDRAEILYYAHSRFGSRKAQGLSYAVQGMDPFAAAHRKAAKLRRRMTGGEGVPRCRGHSRHIMACRVEAAEAMAKSLYRERLAGAVDRSGARRIPGSRSR